MERLDHLPKVTWPVSGRAGVQAQSPGPSHRVYFSFSSFGLNHFFSKKYIVFIAAQVLDTVKENENHP